MKRVLLLVMILICLTGCSVNYEMEFSSDSVKERITSEFRNSSFDNDELAEIGALDRVNAFVSNDSIKHNGGVTTKGNKTKVDLSYDYNIWDMNDVYLLNTCFDSYTFVEDDNSYYLRVMGQFGCLYGDKVNVSLITDRVVLDTNGRNKGDKYTWTIDKNNKDDVDMYIEMSKNYATKSGGGSGISTLRIVGFVILAILCGLVVVMAILFNRNSSNYSEY